MHHLGLIRTETLFSVRLKGENSDTLSNNVPSIAQSEVYPLIILHC